MFSETWEDGTQDDRWYEWRLQNWDTKWEAYDKEIAHADEDTFQVTFNTAWSPPEGIYARIKENSMNYMSLGFLMNQEWKLQVISNV